MLSETQKEIVTTNKKKSLVVSCAGSGKTRCLVARLQFLLDNGVKPEDIVAITFTNAAAQEISERLNSPEGLFIGTIHSLANNYLRAAGVDTYEYIEREQFNHLFELVKQNPHCVKKVKHLLLDEGQDSTEQQFEFMLDMISPECWMIFADWRQSIFRWNGAYPDYIISLAHQSDVTTFDLDENYRNGKRILDFAKSIIRENGYDYLDESIPVSSDSGRVLETEYSPHAIARTLVDYTNYGDWFILTRTNDQIDEICNFLKIHNVPYDTFKRAQLDNKELNKKMKENTVKVLTIHTAKGLEAENVIVIGAKFFNVEERCVSYVAATRAKKFLVWTRMPSKKKKDYGISSWER